MRRPGHRNSDERGFVLVLVALMLVVLVLLVGFAIDLGSWYLRGSKLQRASDAAALAGASGLPSIENAEQLIAETYERNGLIDGENNIAIETTVTSSIVRTSARDTSVPTYFLKLILPQIGITRESQAQQGALAPILGSPFNVLGTGDLDIPGLPSRQNFWLAINNACSPKEDGDYFAAAYDKNKGPLLNSFVPGTYDFQSAADGKHHCPNDPNTPGAPLRNSGYDPSGYSYFINVPKPPEPNGTVQIKVYDPAFSIRNDDDVDYPNYSRSLNSDSAWPLGDSAYNLWNTNGTPEDYSDDIAMLPGGRPFALDSEDSRAPSRQWWTLATIPSASIVDGGEFRLQVFARPLGNLPTNLPEGSYRGVNSFAIGAFPSWKSNGSVAACNSRVDDTCPQVYGRNSISVFNHLDGLASGSTADFYFAEIAPTLVGVSFNVMLWDPGEGVTAIQLLAPDGTPLSFTYQSSENGPGAASPVTVVNTSGVESPAREGVSNAYIFNDRLLTLSVTIPANYASLTKPNDNYLRIRYTVDDSPDDRTTWGISFPTFTKGGPPHLTMVTP